MVLTIIVIFSFLSSYLAYYTNKRIFLKSELLKYMDDRRELQIMIRKNQHDMLKSQESDIRVATLSERNRIAREIHDNVGHMLTRSILMVGALSSINKQENLSEPLVSLKGTLDGAMNSIRNSVHGLRDDSVDLKETILKIISEFTFCPITLDYDMDENIEKDTKYCFITIIKEALSNIIKHTNATKVNITLREHPGLYQLLIDDNGSLNKSQSSHVAPDGMGLESMTERVHFLKGTIYFKNNKGFRIFVTIPKQNHTAD